MKIHVPFKSRRLERVHLMQHLQHAFPAIALLADGVTGLSAGPALGIVIAGAEILMGGIYLGLFFRSVHRTVRGHAHAGHGHASVDWIELSTIGVLTVELVAHRYETHHWRRPTILMIAVVVIQALVQKRLHAAVEKRLAIHVDDEGVRIGARRRRRFAATWQEISRIDITAHDALVVKASGQERRIDFADLRNADDVRDALKTAKHHLSTVTNPSLPEDAHANAH